MEAARGLELDKTRVEVKLKAQTEGSGMFDVGMELPGGLRLESRARRGVTEVVTLWKGTLAEAGAAGGSGRYTFSGQLPEGQLVTASLPHGSATATVDVIINRRMRRDQHLVRPIEIRPNDRAS